MPPDNNVKVPKNLNEVEQYLMSLFLLDQGRYASLSADDKGQDFEAKQIIEDLLKAHENHALPVSIEEVYRFECALLRLEPIEKIRRMGWNVRALYRALAGPDQYDLYLKSDPPDLQGRSPAVGANSGPLLAGDELKANTIALRADMQTLTGEIFRILSLIPQREQLRNRATRYIGVMLIAFWVVVIVIGVGVTVLGPLYSQNHSTVHIEQIWVIFPVCVAGATGAFISVQRRLQNLPINDASTIGFYALYYGRQSLILSPIAGVVFSGLLYLIFSGGLVKGDLFPDIVNDLPGRQAQVSSSKTTPAPTGESRSNPAATKTDFVEYAYHTGPSSGTQWAKLLVWSFLAGFAEQLVPDILDRITRRQAAIENTKEVKTG